jgi:hypothetical protein
MSFPPLDLSGRQPDGAERAVRGVAAGEVGGAIAPLQQEAERLVRALSHSAVYGERTIAWELAVTRAELRQR